MGDDRGAAIDSGSPPALPRRYWWLRRISIAGMALLLVLLGVHLAWAWYARRTLQRLVDDCWAADRAGGAAGSGTPAVRDEENAVLVLDEAVIVLAPHMSECLGWMARQPHYVPYRLDDAKALLRASVHARTLARKARSMRHADWGVRVHQPPDKVVKDLRRCRRLARVLCVASIYEHQTGDHASAIETIRDALSVARTVDAHPADVAHRLARCVICSATLAVEAVAPDLLVARAGDKGGGPVAAADREKVRALIAELLNEEAFRRRAFQVRRSALMKQLETWGVVAEGKVCPGVFAWQTGVPRGLVQKASDFLYRPAVFLDAARMLRAYGVLAGADAPLDWPAAKVTLPGNPTTGTPLEQFMRPLSSRRPAVLDELAEADLLTLAMRRMAAVALAIRLYRLDHDRFPEALGDLVPDYIPYVPADPFAPGRQEIRYSPGPVRWKVYSVGTDGVDGGGTAKFLEHPPRQLDVLFTLERQGGHQLFAWWAALPPSRRGGLDSVW